MLRHVWPLAALASLLLGSRPIHGETTAPRSSGYVNADVAYGTVKSDGVELSMYVRTIGYWEVWTIVGEPVVFCLLAWRIPRNQPLPSAMVDGRGPHSIPREVADQVGLIDADLTVQVRAFDGKTVSLTCDVGALAPAAQASEAAWRKVKAWSKAERDRYFSFNTPGSPDWGELFRDDGGNWVDAERAKQIVAAGFGAHVPGNAGRSARYGITSASFNLAPIRAYLAEDQAKQVAKLADGERKEAAKRATRQQQRDAAVAPDDFWGGPDDPETAGERDQRVAREKKLADAQSAAARAKQQADRLTADNEAKRARKLDEVKSRPPPGGDRQLVLAERRVVELLDGYSGSLPDGEDAACTKFSQQRLSFSARKLGPCRFSLETRWQRMLGPRDHPISMCGPSGPPHQESGESRVNVDFRTQRPTIRGASLEFGSALVESRMNGGAWRPYRSFPFGWLMDADPSVANELFGHLRVLADKCPRSKGPTP